MHDICPGELVVLCCQKPKEKMWGLLVRIDTSGVVLRGLDLGSVEDWLRQERSGDREMIVPSTVFVPMHRVQRMYCDESNEAFRSYGDRFLVECGRDARDALRHGRPEVESGGEVH